MPHFLHAKLVRLFVVEIIHPYSNSKFDMSVIFTANFISGRRHLCRQ
jgi:hypothetical protein